jgi:hypothetical protein
MTPGAPPRLGLGCRAPGAGEADLPGLGVASPAARAAFLEERRRAAGLAVGESAITCQYSSQRAKQQYRSYVSLSTLSVDLYLTTDPPSARRAPRPGTCGRSGGSGRREICSGYNPTRLKLALDGAPLAPGFQLSANVSVSPCAVRVYTPYLYLFWCSSLTCTLERNRVRTRVGS